MHEMDGTNDDPRESDAKSSSNVPEGPMIASTSEKKDRIC
jgi:hypothetical protein